MADDSSATRRPWPHDRPVPGERPSRIVRTVALCLLLAVGAPLGAQGLDPARETAGPSIKLGETDLYPSLRLGVSQVDNAYRTSDDEQEATVALVSPRVLWLARRRLLTLRASYDGEYARSGESVLEHADHALRLGVQTTPGKRWVGQGSIVYRRDHLAPGTDFTRRLGGSLEEPATFDQFELTADGRYGAEGARGNIGFGLRGVARNYTNLDALTDGRGYTFVEPYGRFSLRVAGDTRAFVELRAATVDYEEDLRNRDDLSLYGGVSFAVTERTGSAFQIGVTRSSYDAAAIEDETTLVAAGTLRYEPRDYSRLQLVLRREIDNTAGVTISTAGAAAVRTGVRVDWEYDWSERVSQTAYGEVENIERSCPNASETITALGLELALGVRRWLDLGLGVGGDGRVGDTCDEAEADAADDLDYDQLRFELFARARL